MPSPVWGEFREYVREIGAAVAVEESGVLNQAIHLVRAILGVHKVYYGKQLIHVLTRETAFDVVYNACGDQLFAVRRQNTDALVFRIMNQTDANVVLHMAKSLSIAQAA